MCSTIPKCVINVHEHNPILVILVWYWFYTKVLCAQTIKTAHSKVFSKMFQLTNSTYGRPEARFENWVKAWPRLNWSKTNLCLSAHLLPFSSKLWGSTGFCITQMKPLAYEQKALINGIQWTLSSFVGIVRDSRKKEICFNLLCINSILMKPFFNC